MIVSINKNNNIAITGALGQDGIILSQILLKQKFKVHGIIKKNTKKNLKLKKVNYKSIDLSNFKQLMEYLDKIDPACLIHLGAENPNVNELNKKDFYKKNLKITKNLIEYFSKKKPKNKLILIGSSQMFNQKRKVINVKTNFNPINSYAKFRTKSFNCMIKYKKKYKSNIVMAILFNHDSKYRKKKFLIPRLIKMIKNKQFKKLNEIYQENIAGDFSHAEDICGGLFKLIFLKKNINKVILSSNNQFYINDIINFLLKRNNIKKKFILKNQLPLSTPVGDNTISKKLLSWKIKKNILIAADELNKFIK